MKYKNFYPSEDYYDPIYDVSFLHAFITESIMIEFDDCRLCIDFIDIDTDNSINIKINDVSIVDQIKDLFESFINNKDYKIKGDDYNIECDIKGGIIKFKDSCNTIIIPKDEIDIEKIREVLEELKLIIEDTIDG